MGGWHRRPRAGPVDRGTTVAFRAFTLFRASTDDSLRPAAAGPLPVAMRPDDAGADTETDTPGSPAVRVPVLAGVAGHRPKGDAELGGDREAAPQLRWTAARDCPAGG